MKGKSDIKWHYNGPKDAPVPKTVELPPLTFRKRQNIRAVPLCRQRASHYQRSECSEDGPQNGQELNDPEVKPEIISNVLRDLRCVEDGKVCSFVTATSPQTCKALVTGGQKHLKNGVEWVFYERKKRSQSEGTEHSDLDSNFADFEFIGTEVPEILLQTFQKISADPFSRVWSLLKTRILMASLETLSLNGMTRKLNQVSLRQWFGTRNSRERMERLGFTSLLSVLNVLLLWWRPD